MESVYVNCVSEAFPGSRYRLGSFLTLFALPDSANTSGFTSLSLPVMMKGPELAGRS